jgi:beta-lactamase superfamily II metal-dependent hydrolase
MATRKAKLARKAKVAKKSTRGKRIAPVTKKRATKPGPGTAPTPGAAAPVAAPGAGSAQWTPQAGEVGIRVRMYRVGFGDFFFLTYLPSAGEPVHIVIDCGVFKGTSQTGDIGSIEAAVADMVQTTGGKLALLIVTHRHADHIAGFARCAAAFRGMSVQAIWMSIWESQYSATAVKFQAELTRTALALQDHFTALGVTASEQQNTARKYMENATGEGQPGGGSNAAALDLLKHGFTGVVPEYYQGGSNPRLPAGLMQAGITAQILGPPPIADLDLMKLMDLQKGVGQYLVNADLAGTQMGAPFARKWEMQPGKTEERDGETLYAPDSYREWLENRNNYKPISSASAQAARSRMEEVLAQSQPVAALVAAKQLNSFLNNQSLVVLFTIRGKKLLFVGDAQAGNWEHWLFDTDNPEKTPGSTVGATAQQILSSLDFYKMGHHGSGNATPKAAVATMGLRGQKFASMCSTQAGVYGTEDPDDPTKGTEVPRLPLIDKLAAESAFVRSDQIAITVDGKTIEAEAAAPLPTGAPGTRFEQGSFWIDCYL